MKQYLDAIRFILENGNDRNDRTGTGTRGVFGYQMRFNLKEGFPATTTKKLAWKGVVSELLWFLEGSSDERRLCEILHGTRDTSKTTIWTANANAPYWKTRAKFEGDLGNVYGVMWRSWPSANGAVDQVSQVIESLKTDPYSRRHIISAWNPGEIPNMALPPCHALAQFYVCNGELSCQLYQRSVDVGLGLPFNIASYALLTHMIAQIVGLKVGEFVHTSGDMHVYRNHIKPLTEQITRTPHNLPRLVMPEFSTLDELIATSVNDYKLEDYNPDQSIFMPMAV